MRFVANHRISVDHRTLGPQVMCTDVRELKRTLYLLGGLFYPCIDRIFTHARQA